MTSLTLDQLLSMTGLCYSTTDRNRVFLGRTNRLSVEEILTHTGIPEVDRIYLLLRPEMLERPRAHRFMTILSEHKQQFWGLFLWDHDLLSYMESIKDRPLPPEYLFARAKLRAMTPDGSAWRFSMDMRAAAIAMERQASAAGGCSLWSYKEEVELQFHTLREVHGA